ncbi:hypothetical protein, partial [Sphingomonas koreensis]|uniref:hypothetical protein n=1 Tax=Sphingomonas koreensis TaxID=93064 RepID=UPI0013DF63C0
MTNRANCPGLSEITVRDFPKSLSATYRNRCPGLSETRNLDGEVVDMRDSGGQFLPGIAAIGEETAQGRIGVATAFDEVR